jgi:hypothetical protein
VFQKESQRVKVHKSNVISPRRFTGSVKRSATKGIKISVSQYSTSFLPVILLFITIYFEKQC